MRTWIKSACVVFAWSILSIIPLVVGMKGSVHPARASTRTTITLTSTLSVATALVAAASPARPARPAKPAKYVVQDGDTLSGIAARFAVRGGWPALYAANRALIGPNPNLIEPGSVLALPGLTAPVRYAVRSGDTLSAIAAELAVRGGWPVLYAANRRAIGTDPDVIHPGTVLKIPGPAAPSRRRPSPHQSPRPRENPTPPPSPGAGSGHATAPATRTTPAKKGAHAATGMPQWLSAVLLTGGLFLLAAVVAEQVLVIRRRRRRASGAGPPGGGTARIVLADHERLVVTCDRRDGSVYVLRPPGENPKAIMRVARLILPEDRYQELARHLGLPATWPIVLADHERLVVTCDRRDDTVYVLRPPGADPMAIMRVARLVLEEDPYRELAEHLGVPASWPLR